MSLGWDESSHFLAVVAQNRYKLSHYEGGYSTMDSQSVDASTC
jgi:hypothetical protein